MPLQPGKSKKTIGHNIEAETKAGKPQDQALAIALHTAHPNEKGYAQGGAVVTDKSQGDEFTDGIKSGVNSDMDAVKDYLMQMFGGKDQIMNGNPNMSPTLPGLQNIANQQAGTLPPAANEVSTDNGFAAGGVVGDDGSDFLSKLNAGTAMTPQTPQFDPKAGLPPAPPPAPVAQAPLAPQNNDISGYLAAQKAKIGQYGPEQQMQVSNDILQRQNGLQGRVANAGAGLADALMQGVARAGSSNFQSNLQNRQNQQGQVQLDALKNAREANVQNVGAGQKLDEQDPNSTVSKATQASQGLTLAALGFDPKTISKMSASEIPAAISTLKDLGLKERELVVAKYKAQIEANALGETMKHNRAEEGLKGTELAQTAQNQKAEQGLKGQEIGAGMLEKSATEPLMSRLAGVVGLNPAGKALQNEALDGANTGAHPDDAKAIAWAQANPTDPRAARIKALHGIQ